MDFDSVVIGDFNLATWQENGAVSGEAVGTYLYCSPEQRTRKPCTSKTDVYSMGIMFFELYNLFGTQMERVHVLQKLHERELPAAFRKSYPEASQLILWMCSEQPENRPTGQQLLEHSFFQAIVSPAEYRNLRQQIQLLERMNQEKQTMIEEQAKHLAGLEQQLKELQSKNSV